MKLHSKLLAISFLNLIGLLIGVVVLELTYGRWLKVKPFVPNILPQHGMSHDLSLLRDEWGITTRVPDEHGATVYSLGSSRSQRNSATRCSLLVLGGSTAEERILNREDTWTYRLFRELNDQYEIKNICSDGMHVANAAVNGHSIVANYFDVIYWIAKFKQRYSTAIVYQGINDFQGELLESPDWYDLYWQHITYGLRYNSILARLFDSFHSGRFKWVGPKSDYGIKETVLVTPYQKDLGTWRNYNIDPVVYSRLSIGLANHGRYISLLAAQLKKLGVSHIIWITQTKPFCKLHDMPHALSVRGSKTTQDKLNNLMSLEEEDVRKWLAHDRLGDCIRLGLIRSSYLKSSSHVSRSGIASTVIDYGALTETDIGSYDDYHKTPAGSLALWEDFVRLGLLKSVVDHMLQLPTQ